MYWAIEILIHEAVGRSLGLWHTPQQNLQPFVFSKAQLANPRRGPVSVGSLSPDKSPGNQQHMAHHLEPARVILQIQRQK